MSKVVLAAAAAAAAYYLYKNQKEDEPAEEVVRVSHAEALEQTTKALRAVGWDAEGASVQAAIMVSSEACGNNQGLVKMFKPELMAPAPNAGKPQVERETASSAVINGHQSPGMLALTKAVDLACAKSKGGVASVGVYNTSTSSGQLAFYGERAAKQGRIVIITANSPEFVAAKAGANASFGTNPLCFACPVEGRTPFVFDMSTAAIALFGVLTCKAKGQPLPPKSAYDLNGNWTTRVEDIHIGGGKGAEGSGKGGGEGGGEGGGKGGEGGEGLAAGRRREKGVRPQPEHELSLQRGEIERMHEWCSIYEDFFTETCSTGRRSGTISIYS